MRSGVWVKGCEARANGDERGLSNCMCGEGAVGVCVCVGGTEEGAGERGAFWGRWG